MLAVVIPYYKIDFFEECLSSLAGQNCNDFKVYIGDDASPDNPLCIIEKFNNRLDITYKKFEENIGGKSLTGQWERCIEMIQDEEWIMLLCDDDYISTNFIEEFYKNLDEILKRQINVVKFASKVLETDGRFSKLYTHPKMEKSTDFFIRNIFHGSRGSLSENIFSRTAYEKNGFRDFPLAWGADNFAWLDFSNFGWIYCINNAESIFRISQKNISRPKFNEELKASSKYQYISIIVHKYLFKFKRNQRKLLILYFEQLTYSQKKISFFFWSILSFHLLINGFLIQQLKFTRRVLIQMLK